MLIRLFSIEHLLAVKPHRINAGSVFHSCDFQVHHIADCKVIPAGAKAGLSHAIHRQDQQKADQQRERPSIHN